MNYFYVFLFNGGGGGLERQWVWTLESEYMYIYSFQLSSFKNITPNLFVNISFQLLEVIFNSCLLCPMLLLQKFVLRHCLGFLAWPFCITGIFLEKKSCKISGLLSDIVCVLKDCRISEKLQCTVIFKVLVLFLVCNSNKD